MLDKLIRAPEFVLPPHGIILIVYQKADTMQWSIRNNDRVVCLVHTKRCSSTTTNQAYQIWRHFIESRPSMFAYCERDATHATLFYATTPRRTTTSPGAKSIDGRSQRRRRSERRGPTSGRSWRVIFALLLCN